MIIFVPLIKDPGCFMHGRLKEDRSTDFIMFDQIYSKEDCQVLDFAYIFTHNLTVKASSLNVRSASNASIGILSKAGTTATCMTKPPWTCRLGIRATLTYGLLLVM